MKMLQVLGCTLILAAGLMHFCFCEWKDPSHTFLKAPEYGSEILFFVCARSQFRDPVRADYDLATAGVWGLVVPVVMAGGGLALLCHDPRKPRK